MSSAYAPLLPVETARLRLRQYSRGDVDAVYGYRRLPEVARHLLDEPMSREACTEAVQARIGQTELLFEGDKLFLAVEAKEEPQLVGEVSLILRSKAALQGELGYIFAPAHQGKGYATEAAQAMLALGFDGAGLHRIYARCAAANVASYRVMERLGMRREAHFRDHAVVKGHWDAELIYAILEDEWRATKR